MLELNLAPIFKARGIHKPYSFLVQEGFTVYSANNILRPDVRNIKLDSIEELCKVLVCEPSDLFLYTPDKTDRLPADHPLTKLAEEEDYKNVLDKFASMPLKQLKELARNMVDGK